MSSKQLTHRGLTQNYQFVLRVDNVVEFDGLE